MTQLLHTSFYQAHLNAGAKMVDFAGYSLPIHYGSQLKEHEIVRTDAGMFDVSHMAITDVVGSGAKAWLRYLLANDVEKLTVVGKALYSAMLNHEGGVLDDLIVYLTDCGYRIVSNAATRDKDFAWFTLTSNAFDVKLTPRDDVSMLAIQGPNAIQKLLQAKPEWTEKVNSLTPFVGAFVDDNDEFFVARTGYTGEDGVEVMLPDSDAIEFFDLLVSVGVKPCGLGARDTLRLEAGMNLYGHDMDEETTPLEAGMGWTVAMNDDRDFIGKSALQEQKAAGVNVKQVGLVLDEKGVLRDGMTVHVDGVTETGVITSGSFSPTLGQSIAIARVPTTVGDKALVDIRNKLVPVRVVKLPFVRHGKKLFA